jgi:ribonuclease VapC
MIILDSSAVIALLRNEPTAGGLEARLATDRERAMSVASYLEVGTVLAGRLKTPLTAVDELEAFLADAGIELRPVDEAQARLALQARIRFGRGMGHGGTLNYGDTFAYALAKSLDAPLLFVGDDFTKTDVKVALDPR